MIFTQGKVTKTAATILTSAFVVLVVLIVVLTKLQSWLSSEFVLDVLVIRHFDVFQPVNF